MLYQLTIYSHVYTHMQLLIYECYGAIWKEGRDVLPACVVTPLYPVRHFCIPHSYHITALSPLFGSTFNTYATSTSSIYTVMIISYRLVTTSGLKLLEHNAGHSFSVIDYLIAAKFNIVDAEILFWQCISLHHRHSYRCSTEVLKCS